MKKFSFCIALTFFPSLYFLAGNFLLCRMEEWSASHYRLIPLYVARAVVFVLLGCVVALLGKGLRGEACSKWIPASIATGLVLTIVCFAFPFLLPPPAVGADGFALAGVAVGVWACWLAQSLRAYRRGKTNGLHI